MPPGNRPKEIHTRHLTELERFRVRTLYYDACMSKKRIEEVTGYSSSQIRTAIRAKSAAVGTRTGRPKKARNGQTSADQQPDEAGPSSQGAVSEDPAGIPGIPAPAEPHPSDPSRERQQRGPASFNRLPAELRRHIWYLVLTSSSPSAPPPATPTPSHPASPSSPPPPPSSPLSCVWWVEPLPQPPWLAAGVFPEHWSTHWKAYLGQRQAAARQLCGTSREARRVVLETLAPVWSEAGLRMLGAPLPFLWLDPRRDGVYCKDDAAAAAAATELPALFDKARAAVLPHLGRGRASSSSGGDGGSSRSE
ncbi:hypothetical protein F4677DRAFT_458613 [Hypoxylon crocopeplum]|nr:hypothetical protein F4677DRAFT_458613 [Hypoxylon crocopeplum]